MKHPVDKQRRMLLGTAATGMLLTMLPAGAANAKPRRVAVAGGAITEVVYALDAGAMLIGSDTTSTYPAAALALPKMGYQRALSAEGVLSLRPDLLLASAEAGPPTALQQIAAAGVRIITLSEQHDVQSVRDKISGSAKALDLASRGESLLQSFDSDWQTAMTDIQTQRQQQAGKPPLRVLFILSNSGAQAMVAGRETAADAMIRYAGAVNVLGGKDGFKGYKPLTAESAIAAAPDVLMTTSEGLASMGGLEQLLKMPGLALTPAARNKRVIADMDALLLLGFGPRLPAALRRLAAQLTA